MFDPALPIHPRTGLRALGMSRRGPIWPILGAAEDAADTPGDPGGTPAPPPSPSAGDDKGYPPNTPWRDMTAPQQAAYWMAQSKKHEGRVNAMSDYESLKDKAAQYDALADASRTEQERAVETARAEGKAAGLQEAAPRLVRAEFRHAAKGRITDAARDAFLEDLDFSKYLTDKGEVDEAKVAARIDAIAPKEPTRPTVQLGQGRTASGAKPSVAQVMADRAQARAAKAN